MGKGEQGQANPHTGGLCGPKELWKCPDPSTQSSEQWELMCMRGVPALPALTAPLRAGLRPGDGSLLLHLLLDCVC